MLPAVLAILAAAADTWTTLRGVRRGLREGNPAGCRVALAAKWAAVGGAVWYGDPVLLGVLALLYVGAALWNVRALRRAGLLALALLAAPPALACAEHACSNDPRVLGDERLAWDPAERATSYEVCDLAETACVTTSAPELLVDGTSLAERMGVLRVRACNEVGCSPWSAGVEFEPVADLRHTNCRQRPEPDGWGCDTCEVPSQGWRRLPHLPEC